jgi:hypothetical protein
VLKNAADFSRAKMITNTTGILLYVSISGTATMIKFQINRQTTRVLELFKVSITVSDKTDTIYTMNINSKNEMGYVYGSKDRNLVFFALRFNSSTYLNVVLNGIGISTDAQDAELLDYIDPSGSRYITAVSSNGFINRQAYKVNNETGSISVGVLAGFMTAEMLVGINNIKPNLTVVIGKQGVEGRLLLINPITMTLLERYIIYPPHSSRSDPLAIAQEGSPSLVVYFSQQGAVNILNIDALTIRVIAPIDNDLPIATSPGYPLVSIYENGVIRIFDGLKGSLVTNYTLMNTFNIPYMCATTRGNTTLLSTDGYDLLVLKYNGTSFSEDLKIFPYPRAVLATQCQSATFEDQAVYLHGLNKRGKEAMVKWSTNGDKSVKAEQLIFTGSGLPAVALLDEIQDLLLIVSISGLIVPFDISGIGPPNGQIPVSFIYMLAIFITLGIVTLTAVIFFVLYWRIRYTVMIQRKKSQLMYSMLEERLIPSNAGHRTGFDWLIKVEDLTFEQRISEGTFGVVFKGKYRGGQVAIKKLKLDDYDEFEHEVEILSRLRHPNIVLFMGVCFQNEYKLIVTEYMPNMSIDHLLYKKNAAILSQNIELDDRVRHRAMTFEKKLDILCDVIKGMIYLHSHDPPIVHRDIKTSNILLDANLNAKVCDFGQSRLVAGGAASIRAAMTSNIGTTQYMAPEVILDLPYNEACDIYSFGIVMYEIFYERPPFQEENNSDDSDQSTNVSSFGSMITLSIDVAQKGRRPTIPVYSANDARAYTQMEVRYLDVMRQCWQHDAGNRPSFEEVLEILSEIRDDQALVSN